MLIVADALSKYALVQPLKSSVRELHSYLSNLKTKQQLIVEWLKKQSSKAENEKQEVFKARQADGHVESTSEDAEQMKSVQFLN